MKKDVSLQIETTVAETAVAIRKQVYEILRQTI